MTRAEVFQQALERLQMLEQQSPDHPLLSNSLLKSAQIQLQYLLDLDQQKRDDWQRLEDITLGLIAVREIEGRDDTLANWIYESILPAVKEMKIEQIKIEQMKQAGSI